MAATGGGSDGDLLLHRDLCGWQSQCDITFVPDSETSDVTMLAQVYPLPCAQLETATVDGHAERGTNQRALHMSRHVVRAFERVLKHKKKK